MHSALPPWMDLSAEHPPRLPGDIDSPRVVAVLATEKARAAGWPATGAVDLARAWRSVGRSVVLVDAGVTAPSLHSVLGVPNAEGVSDVVLFGASPARVAIRVEDGLSFVPAGTLTADVPAVFYSERWDRLVSAVRGDATTVVLFAGTDEPGLGQVRAAADDIVILGSVGDDVLPWVDDPEPVRALLSIPRAGSASDQDELVDPLDPLAIDPLRESGPSSPDDTDDSEASLPNQAADAEVNEEMATEGPQSRKEAPTPGPAAPGHPLGRRLAVAAVVLVALGWGGVRSGLLSLPGLGARAAAVEASPAADAPAAASPAAEASAAGVPADEAPASEVAARPPAQEAPRPGPATPAGRAASARVTSPAAPFSITLASFRDPEAAQASLRALQPKIAGTLMQIAPVIVNGTPYHRLLVGAATDSLEAVALGQRIAGKISADAGAWVIRRTPLAFLLAETESRSDALRGATVAWESAIPAYVLRVEYDDGHAAYRVYSGAYADQKEASHMGEILTGTGRETRLVERVGTEPEG